MTIMMSQVYMYINKHTLIDITAILSSGYSYSLLIHISDSVGWTNSEAPEYQDYSSL